MSKLYEITGALKDLESGEFEDQQSLIDTLEAVQGEFNEKAVSIVKFTENLNGDISAIDAEIKRLQARKRAIENKRQSVRDYLLHNMRECQITSIECPLFTAKLRKGIDSVVVDDESKIPDRFIETVISYKVDKKALKLALQSGEEIEGAHIKQGEQTLVIK